MIEDIGVLILDAVLYAALDGSFGEKYPEYADDGCGFQCCETTKLRRWTRKALVRNCPLCGVVLSSISMDLTSPRPNETSAPRAISPDASIDLSKDRP